MNEVKKIKVAGFGGQGVLFLGKFIAELANKLDYNITWLPSYGPEMRGGTANCDVIISKKQIGSPLIDNPNILISLNQPSFDKFYPRIEKNALVIINSDLIKSEEKNLVKIKASTLAEGLGNEKILNMVIAGYLIKKLNLFDKKIIQEIFKNAGLSNDLIELNFKALATV